MRRRALLIAGLCAVMTLGAARPKPERWPVVREESAIRLSVKAFGMPRNGRFQDWRGDIAFDPAAPEQTRATIVIQAASLDMGSSVVTARAVGAGFLDAGRSPTIRVEVRALRPVGGGHYLARSDVTLKGVTRSIEYPVDLRVDGDRAHLMAAITLDRAQFGIGTTTTWNRLIDRQVMVRATLVARRP
ncbi:MAG: YceI family protein [Brevundimonas sp.]|nr:MAG: YceI family protein [Brevundimonas sp.]